MVNNEKDFMNNKENNDKILSKGNNIIKINLSSLELEENV